MEMLLALKAYLLYNLYIGFFLYVSFCLEIELVMHTSYLASVNLLTHKCSSETESSNKCINYHIMLVIEAYMASLVYYNIYVK